ncbi:MAG: sortase [Ktedonobacterales bacterium]
MRRYATFSAVLCVLLLVLAPSAALARGKGYYSPLIVIPRLGIDQKAQATLAAGPVVYYYDQGTGTIGIAGHDVTPVPGYSGHGPFRYIYLLQKGDAVYVNHFRYHVVGHAIVRPNSTWVLNFKGVVLSACYPAHSAAYRYVVFAAPGA